MDNKKIAKMVKVLLANGYQLSDVEEFARSMNEYKAEVYHILDSEEVLKERIKDILEELNAPEDMIGYDYLIEAILYSFNKPKILEEALLSSLYKPIGSECCSTPSEVRDKIQEIINVMWSKMSADVKVKYFTTRYKDSDTPISKVFLKKLVEYLKS